MLIGEYLNIMENIEINIFNIVGNSFCVEANDGEKVYTLLKKAVENNKKVILSFQNVEMLTPAFLNTAIGQIYRDFDEELIKKLLSADNILPEDKVLLKRVTKTAKLFYKNPERMLQSINKILGE